MASTTYVPYFFDRDVAIHLMNSILIISRKTRVDVADLLAFHSIVMAWRARSVHRHATLTHAHFPLHCPRRSDTRMARLAWETLKCARPIWIAWPWRGFALNVTVRSRCTASLLAAHPCSIDQAALGILQR
jgi:hypothetical protein